MATVTYKDNKEQVIVKDTNTRAIDTYILQGTLYKCNQKAISSKNVPDRVYDLLNA